MTIEKQPQEIIYQNEDIDLRRVIRTLWAGKWLIVALAGVSAAASLLVALLLPDIYRAEVLLVPNHQDQQSGMARLASQYGGLASLAGIDVGSVSLDKSALGIEIMQSRKFLADFVEKHELLVPLMAATGWDAENDHLYLNQDLYDEKLNSWVRVVDPPRTKIPSRQEAYEALSELLTVDQDSDTGFVTVSIDHYSPKFAKQWVDWIVQDLNETMQMKDVEEAGRAIEYLREQIDSTSLSGLQGVFFRLIEEQTKTIMLAKVSPEYVFQSVDPAVIPEERVSPHRLLILIAGILAGGMLGVLICLLRRYPSSSVSD